MKVFALTVLLISICCLEGALVKRQAEEGAASNPFTAQFTEFVQRMQQQADQFASLIKNRFAPEQLEEIKSQAESILQRMQDSFSPLTEQMTQNVARLFSPSAEANPPAQEGA